MMHNPLQTMLFLGDKYFIDKSDHVTIFTKCQLQPPPIINDMSSIHILSEHRSKIIINKNQLKIAITPWVIYAHHISMNYSVKIMLYNVLGYYAAIIFIIMTLLFTGNRY